MILSCDCMVDLVVLQSLSYTAGAISVVLGVIYYAINLRETTKNRKVAFTTNLLSTSTSKEGMRDYYELLSMQWTDFDDFKRKYDSRINPENFLKRAYMWNIYDHVGWQLKAGVVDFDTVRKSVGRDMMNMWLKFQPIINEYRKKEYSSEDYADWEYIADRMEEVFSLEEREKAHYIIDDAFKHENIRTT
jgi:hypothetical protein